MKSLILGKNVVRFLEGQLVPALRSAQEAALGCCNPETRVIYVPLFPPATLLFSAAAVGD